MKRKKLIIISASYPYGLKETFLENEIQYLSRYFDIDICPIINNAPSQNTRPLPGNVTFHNPFLVRNYFQRIMRGIFNSSPILPYIRDFIRLIKAPDNLRKKTDLWFQRFVISRTIFSSKLFKSIVAIPGNILYFYWSDIPIGLIKNIKLQIFVRVHGGELELQRNSGFVPMVSSIVIRRENIHYLPISLSAANYLNSIKKVKYTINRLGVYDRGLNPESKNEDVIRIVSCSNMIKLKRIHLIIEALSLINDLKVEWIHFGDGPLFNEIIDLSKSLPSNIKVCLMGRTKNEDVLMYYAKTRVDLFINISETEGVPVSIMEAFSFGIPCFATNAGGTGEIVSNSNGFLVCKNFEIIQLSECIRNSNKSESNTKRQNARKTFENLCNAERNYNELKLILSTK